MLLERSHLEIKKFFLNLNYPKVGNWETEYQKEVAIALKNIPISVIFIRLKKFKKAWRSISKKPVLLCNTICIIKRTPCILKIRFDDKTKIIKLN